MGFQYYIGGRLMKFNTDYEEIIHESADKITAIKKIKKQRGLCICS